MNIAYVGERQIFSLRYRSVRRRCQLKSLTRRMRNVQFVLHMPTREFSDRANKFCGRTEQLVV